MKNFTFLEEFKQNQSTYENFASIVADLLRQIVWENGVAIHSVTSRVKSPGSTEGKLKRAGHTYNEMADMTDLAGIRVTTYFHDDVDLVASLVEREFLIDRSNTIDKRTLLDSNEFGYLSSHYVIELSEQRSGLTEYRRFKNLKAEIQIRSLLQHAWAEIEHDLGYKSLRPVPPEVTRRFARLAGVLESADSEFAAIRDKLATERSVFNAPAALPSDIPLDRLSLKRFIADSEILSRLDSFIGDVVGAVIIPPPNDAALDRNLSLLESVSIKSIRTLDTALIQNEDFIKKFSSHYLANSHYLELWAGITALYLAYVLIVKTKDLPGIHEWLRNNKLGRNASKVADKIIEAAVQAKIFQSKEQRMS